MGTGKKILVSFLSYLEASPEPYSRIVDMDISLNEASGRYHSSCIVDVDNGDGDGGSAIGSESALLILAM